MMRVYQSQIKFAIIRDLPSARALSKTGEVAEWLNVPDSKSGVRANVSGVRIPPSPPNIQKPLIHQGLFCLDFSYGGTHKGASSTEVNMKIACRINNHAISSIATIISFLLRAFAKNAKFLFTQNTSYCQRDIITHFRCDCKNKSGVSMNQNKNDSLHQI